MATALPLGYISDYELADVLLLEEMDPEMARQQLMARMAPGIDVFKMETVAISLPSLQASTLESSYVVTPLTELALPELRQNIEAILTAESVPRERVRKGKVRVYDLRPLILHLALNEEAESSPDIEMRLMLKPSLTGRPDEVLLALGLDPLDCRIRRTLIVLQEQE
jgi:radical SAM-linked protein